TLGGPRAGMILCTEELATAVDRAVFPLLQGGPLMHAIAAKGVCLGHGLTPEFRRTQGRSGEKCRALAEAPGGGGIDLATGGTDNRLLLMDLSDTPLTGQEGEDRLARAGITVNKNAVPFDERPPMVTSGVRVGTPALTTRGMGPEEMREIGRVMVEALAPERSEAELDALRERSRALSDRFPLYPRLVGGFATA